MRAIVTSGIRTQVSHQTIQASAALVAAQEQRLRDLESERHAMTSIRGVRRAAAQ